MSSGWDHILVLICRPGPHCESFGLPAPSITGRVWLGAATLAHTECALSLVNRVCVQMKEMNPKGRGFLGGVQKHLGRIRGSKVVDEARCASHSYMNVYLCDIYITARLRTS